MALSAFWKSLPIDDGQAAKEAFLKLTGCMPFGPPDATTGERRCLHRRRTRTLPRFLSSMSVYDQLLVLECHISHIERESQCAEFITKMVLHWLYKPNGPMARLGAEACATVGVPAISGRRFAPPSKK